MPGNASRVTYSVVSDSSVLEMAGNTATCKDEVEMILKHCRGIDSIEAEQLKEIGIEPQ